MVTEHLAGESRQTAQISHLSELQFGLHSSGASVKHCCLPWCPWFLPKLQRKWICCFGLILVTLHNWHFWLHFWLHFFKNKTKTIPWTVTTCNLLILCSGLSSLFFISKYRKISTFRNMLSQHYAKLPQNNCCYWQKLIFCLYYTHFKFRMFFLFSVAYYFAFWFGLGTLSPVYI